jgi:23S rRNA pseudouridine2605 synthase
MAKLRLNKILAQAGLASRRAADRLIAEGRVAVNGLVAREAGTLADPDRDTIALDGRPIPAAELVPASARLYPVGRLDVDVEGALLLTNDGALTHRLLHPRYGLPRVYEADVAGAVGRSELAQWRRGVTLEDGPAVPTAVALLRGGPGGSRLRLTFTEGRKHEVKRYCQALGHPVVRLRRIAFGPVTLGDLPVGRWRALTPREVAALRGAIAVGR